MALKKSFQSSYGTNHSESYYKVDRVSMANDQMECQVGVYASEAARTANSGSLDLFWYYFPYISSINENFVSQSYEHLKTLYTYTEALDV